MNRKKILFVILTLILLLVCVSACQAANSSGQMTNSENTADEETMIYAHIGDSTLTIRPESNSSAEAFMELLWDGDITIDMHDYGGFEKVGPLGIELPTNDERITTEPGDVILYQGNQITIYYDKNTCFNEVFVRGVETELSNIEYQILLLMMQHSGKIFSAQNLYESVWNEPFFYSCSSTVMVHIRKLRTKIETDPNNPKYIKTLWGKGYRFETLRL